jgi:hypothetical protein
VGFIKSEQPGSTSFQKKPNEFLNPGCIMSYRLIICETNFCAGSCADLPRAGGDCVLFIVHQMGR